MIAGYVISLEQERRDTKYVDFDSNSGCPYWVNNISSAYLFGDMEGAIKELENSDFVKPCKMSSGRIDPPRMIYSGLEIFDQSSKKSGVIYIRPMIIGEPVHSVPVSGETSR